MQHICPYLQGGFIFNYKCEELQNESDRIPAFSTCATQCFSQENRWHKWKIKSYLAKPSRFRRFFSQGNNETGPNWPLIRKKAWYYGALQGCILWGPLRVGFLKLVIINYSGDMGIFLCVDRKERRKEGRGRWIRVIYEMRPADFYTAHNGFMRVTGTLGRSRFPKLR